MGGLLVPQPGIKPKPLSVEAWVLTTELPGKSQGDGIFRVQPKWILSGNLENTDNGQWDT